MRGDRLARPGRALLVRRLVAEREDEVELRRVGGLELGDVLGAQTRDVVPEALENLQRVGVELRGGSRSRREGGELPGADLLQDRLGHDRAGGVAHADEEHVEAAVGHRRISLQAGQGTGGKRRAKLGPAAAAVVHQVVDQALDLAERDAVVDHWPSRCAAISPARSSTARWADSVFGLMPSAPTISPGRTPCGAAAPAAGRPRAGQDGQGPSGLRCDGSIPCFTDTRIVGAGQSGAGSGRAESNRLA